MTCVGRLLADTLDDSVQRFTLNQCHQDVAMIFADHHVTLTVTATATGIDVDWALIDRGLPGNDTAPVIGPIALAPGLLAAQIVVQVAA